MGDRYRTRGAMSPPPTLNVMSRWTSCSDSSWHVTSSQQGVELGVVETMSDYTVHDFRKRQMKGEVFFNPLSATRWEVSSRGGSGVYLTNTGNSCASPIRHAEHDNQGDWFQAYVKGVGNTMPAPPYLMSQSDIDALSTEVSTSVRSKRGTAESNLWESYFELSKTAEMLRHPLNGLFRWARINGKKVLKLSPENAWLQYRYGVLPLVRDADAIMKGMKLEGDTQRITSRAALSKRGYKSLTQDYFLGVTRCTVGIQQTDEVTVRAMSLDEVVIDAMYRAGFTWKGLATVPWELIPYSFVADWFVNIGAFWGSQIPIPGCKQLGSALVIERMLVNDYTALSTAPTSATYTMSRPVTGQISVISTTKTRSGLAPSGLVIKENFRLDDFERLSDGFALAKQIFDRLFSRR